MALPTPYHFNPSRSPNYGFVMPTSPSIYMRGYMKYIDAINLWETDAILDCFDDALEHRILPVPLGRPVLNKRGYREYIRGVLPLFRIHKMIIHEIVEAQERMTIHMTVTGSGASGAPYSNETIQIIHWVLPPLSAGPNALPKMRLMKEFVDSEYARKFFTDERTKAKEREEAERQRQERLNLRQTRYIPNGGRNRT